MNCVKGHGSSYNHIDDYHEFHFGETIRREVLEVNKFKVCEVCGMCWAICDTHNRGMFKDKWICHSTQVAYFASSCKYNGTSSAIAGFGISMGDKQNQRWSIPVTRRIDKEKRTNNRTDLLAALECIRKMVFAYTHPTRPCEARPQTWIVACSSDYVVKNYTENCDNWRARGWKEWGGGEPANLDLWIKLDNMQPSMRAYTLSGLASIGLRARTSEVAHRA